MREVEKLFGSCCFKLQRYVQIAYEGGMLWDDLLTGEAVQTHLLGKDNQVMFSVPKNEVFITRVETNRDVAAMQLTCAWSTTVAGEDMNLRVEVQRARTMTKDLVMGSLKPCSVLIWNGRNSRQE
ncbi:hypothetical protein SLA2020_067370 [Shorea laevis]